MTGRSVEQGSDWRELTTGQRMAVPARWVGGIIPATTILQQWFTGLMTDDVWDLWECHYILG
jgi:hypothetical protein